MGDVGPGHGVGGAHAAAEAAVQVLRGDDGDLEQLEERGGRRRRGAVVAVPAARRHCADRTKQRHEGEQAETPRGF